MLCVSLTHNYFPRNYRDAVALYIYVVYIGLRASHAKRDFSSICGLYLQKGFFLYLRLPSTIERLSYLQIIHAVADFPICVLPLRHRASIFLILLYAV